MSGWSEGGHYASFRTVSPSQNSGIIQQRERSGEGLRRRSNMNFQRPAALKWQASVNSELKIRENSRGHDMLRGHAIQEDPMADTLIEFHEDESEREKAEEICESLGTDLVTYLRICIERLIQEGGFPFRETPEDETLKKGREALEHARRIAQEHGISDMPLDEINAEIAEARKNR